MAKTGSSIHRVGRTTIIAAEDEDHMVEIANACLLALNGVSPGEFRSALRVVATKSHLEDPIPQGGSKGHLCSVIRRHDNFTTRVAERTLSTRALGMIRFSYKMLMNNLLSTGVMRIPPHKTINVDEANVFQLHGKALRRWAAIQVAEAC